MSSVVAYSLERVYPATGCLPRIFLRGKVFIEPLPPIGLYVTTVIGWLANMKVKEVPVNIID
jgi:hypothetical protein